MTESLQGRLLVSAPQLRDPHFDRTVVLCLEHDEEGSLGVVLNRPGALGVSDVLAGWEALAADPAVVFEGGPVSPNGVLGLGLLRAGATLPGARQVTGRLVILDLEADPMLVAPAVEQVRLFAGYAGWASGQLEDELEVGGWFVVEGFDDDAVAFQAEDLWRGVLRRQGGRLAWVANFPPDASLN